MKEDIEFSACLGIDLSGFVLKNLADGEHGNKISGTTS